MWKTWCARAKLRQPLCNDGREPLGRRPRVTAVSSQHASTIRPPLFSDTAGINSALVGYYRQSATARRIPAQDRPIALLRSRTRYGKEEPRDEISGCEMAGGHRS